MARSPSGDAGFTPQDCALRLQPVPDPYLPYPMFLLGDHRADTSIAYDPCPWVKDPIRLYAQRSLASLDWDEVRSNGKWQKLTDIISDVHSKFTPMCLRTLGVKTLASGHLAISHSTYFTLRSLVGIMDNSHVCHLAGTENLLSHADTDVVLSFVGRDGLFLRTKKYAGIQRRGSFRLWTYQPVGRFYIDHIRHNSSINVGRLSPVFFSSRYRILSRQYSLPDSPEAFFSFGVGVNTVHRYTYLLCRFFDLCFRKGFSDDLC